MTDYIKYIIVVDINYYIEVCMNGFFDAIATGFNDAMWDARRFSGSDLEDAARGCGGSVSVEKVKLALEEKLGVRIFIKDKGFQSMPISEIIKYIGNELIIAVEKVGDEPYRVINFGRDVIFGRHDLSVSYKGETCLAEPIFELYERFQEEGERVPIMEQRLETKIKALEKRIEDLRVGMARADKACNELSGQLASSQSETRRAEAALLETRERNRRLEANTERLEKSLAESQADVAKLSGSLSIKGREHVLAITRASESEAENGKLRLGIGRLIQDLDRLRKENQALVTQDETNQRELEQAKATSLTLRDQVKGLTEEIKPLKTDKSKEKLANQFSQLTIAYGRANERIVELEESLKKQQRESLDAERELLNKIQKLEASPARREKQGLPPAEGKLQSANEQLRLENKGLQREIAGLKKSLEEEEAKRPEIVSECDALRREIRKKDEDLKELGVQRDQLYGQLGELVAQLTATESRVKSLEASQAKSETPHSVSTVFSPSALPFQPGKAPTQKPNFKLAALPFTPKQ